MSAEYLREIIELYQTASQKLLYFSLAADGAAIGLALNQTQSAPIVWSQIPLAIAVLCWGLSFFSGVRYQHYVNSNLLANIHLLQNELGQHPLTGNDPLKVVAADKFIRESMERSIKRGSTFAGWHYRLLIMGSIFYIGWHILGMYLRTVAPH